MQVTTGFTKLLQTGLGSDWKEVRKASGHQVHLSDLVRLEDVDGVVSMASKFPSLALVVVRQANLVDTDKLKLEEAVSKSLMSLGYRGGETVSKGVVSGVKKSLFLKTGLEVFCHRYNPKHGGSFWGDQGPFEYVVQIKPDSLLYLKEAKQDYAVFKSYLSSLLSRIDV